jgi:hypothetical protein
LVTFNRINYTKNNKNSPLNSETPQAVALFVFVGVASEIIASISAEDNSKNFSLGSHLAVR